MLCTNFSTAHSLFVKTKAIKLFLTLMTKLILMPQLAFEANGSPVALNVIICSSSSSSSSGSTTWRVRFIHRDPKMETLMQFVRENDVCVPTEVYHSVSTQAAWPTWSSPSAGKRRRLNGRRTPCACACRLQNKVY